MTSFLEFNPMPFLVSITSVLVSVSFAMGSSVSALVEGVLLIAVSRPFDLGDRVIINGSDSVDHPGFGASWFVEDINVFSTVLRFARTNEVATIKNSAIASSKIVNCNRSVNAIVFIEHMLHTSILDEDNLDKFNAALKHYVNINPRLWEAVAFCRIEKIDADMETVNLSIAVRHRNSWQDASRILLNKADMLRYIHDTAKNLNTAYDTPPNRRLLYYGGELEKGDVQDYKKNLLSPSNIRKVNRESAKNVLGTNFNVPPMEGA
jgi:hypothetical protein